MTIAREDRKAFIKKKKKKSIHQLLLTIHSTKDNLFPLSIETQGNDLPGSSQLVSGRERRKAKLSTTIILSFQRGLTTEQEFQNLHAKRVK